jgi:hypothetical protein
MNPFPGDDDRTGRIQKAQNRHLGDGQEQDEENEKDAVLEKGTQKTPEPSLAFFPWQNFAPLSSSHYQ